MDALSRCGTGCVATQPPPPDAVVAGTAVVAAALVLLPRAWPVTRHVVTIVHEGAHGLAALLTGRRLSGIRLHSDTSGVTVSVGRPRGPGMVLTAAAGYVGPALLGWGPPHCSAPGTRSRCCGRCWCMLALLLVQIRNWFGLWSVLASAAVVLAVSWLLPGQAQSAFAYLLAWFLLLSAPRPVLELQAERRRRPFEQLRRGPAGAAHRSARAGVGGRLPRGDLGALVAGARWLLGGLA